MEGEIRNAHCACCFVSWRVLRPPPKHGPMLLIMDILSLRGRVGLTRERLEYKKTNWQAGRKRNEA